jgi:photosystem II stability/assembly factor-like uncharacterized protein
VRAHDPSAWGGLFRTRDAGASWVPVNAGSFVSGAIALAISPVDPNQLLLGTDSGLLRSQNGGRDWQVVAPNVLVGATFAVIFDADGARALASGASSLFRSDGTEWRAIQAPAGAAPVRTLARGSAPGRVYLAGWAGLHRSDDWGTSWLRIGDGLPEEHVDALVVSPGPPELVYVIAGGQLWAGLDGGRQWQPRNAGPPTGRAEMVALDDFAPMRLWTRVNGRLYRSDDQGEHWRAVGRPLPEPDVLVRGIAVIDQAILLATDRGVYRSSDGGDRWQVPSDGLPAHLEAGPMVNDPRNPSTIYVGFAFTPYAELWRQASEGRTMFERLDVTHLAGGAAFLLLLILGAVALLRRLAAAYYRAPLDAPPGPPATQAPGRRNLS